MSKKSTHPVDLHVGTAIRRERTLRGISQEKLGQSAGISFQQVQKYENGSNRVSASMMWKFAKGLGVPVASFFDGLQEAGKTKKFDVPAIDPGMLTLARHYTALKSPAHREAVCSLAKSLAA